MHTNVGMATNAGESRAVIHSLTDYVPHAQYLRLMEKLLGALKLDAHVLDLGTDMIVDAVFGRVEQLTRGEAGQVAEKSTLVYQLQRKLQRLKEQLESKDLHLELMRKKLAQLDERARGMHASLFLLSCAAGLACIGHGF